MTDAFAAWLEAADSARGRFRAYGLEAGADLFGMWLVEVCYGRIVGPCRRLRRAAQDEAEARALVRKAHCPTMAGRLPRAGSARPPGYRGTRPGTLALTRVRLSEGGMASGAMRGAFTHIERR
jgi:hypothetical protein